MATPEQIALSRRCEASAAAIAAQSRESARFGPFLALIDPHEDLIWLNYAVPTAPLADDGPTRAALAALVDHFRARGRRPRFEFNCAPWPALPALLEAAGLLAQERQPLMVCPAAALRPAALPGLLIARLGPASPDADLAAYIAVQQLGFGESAGAITPGRLRWMRNLLRAGLERHVLSILDGRPAGVAAVLAAAEVGELAGVATAPGLRRRGVAAATCSAILADYFAAGGELAWLSAADPGARALYERLGFVTIDERVSYK